MNQDGNISECIVKQFESAGFQAAFLPYHYINQITKFYEELPEKNSNLPFIKDAIEYFRKHHPSGIPFEPLSFLIIACPGEYSLVTLNIKGKRVTVPVPPTYIDDQEQSKRLKSTFESATEGFQTAHTGGISQKMLAVLSGLGRYGRNNTCYIDGMGSFFSLLAFYTDIPCVGALHPLAFMDQCETCSLCRQNCPTGAIGKNPVIDAAKCLTMLNESRQPFPDWLPTDVHHTLVGCLRCQEICPQNRMVSMSSDIPLELDDNEIQALLSSDSDILPAELEQKFRQFGFYDFLLSVAARNLKLAIQN